MIRFPQLRIEEYHNGAKGDCLRFTPIDEYGDLCRADVEKLQKFLEQWLKDHKEGEK